MEVKQLSSLMLLCLMFSAARSQTVTFNCLYVNDYYNPNVMFRNVFINDSMAPVFSCNYYNSPQQVHFQNSSLEQVPKSLFNTFRELRNVTLSACGIKSILPYQLEAARYLTHLNLSKNMLTRIPGYAFSGANNLLLLDLSFNNITAIENTAFGTLKQLQVLDLSENKLGELDSGVFKELESLTSIFLNNNQLQVVERDLLANSIKLKNIILKNNRISVIEDGSFAHPSMNLISLSNNYLTLLNMTQLDVKQLFVQNNKIHRLHLPSKVLIVNANNNNISSVTAEQPYRITSLLLESNAITSLETIGQLRSLNILDLGINHLGPLNLTTFAKLTNLQQLRLKGTSISNLQHGTFANLEKLTSLDLSYNDLDSIDIDIFTSSTDLQYLFLDGNRLKSVHYEYLKKMFPRLKVIGLEDNHWNCTYLTKLLRYCTENSITLYKTHSDVVLNQTNVKGIYCYDDKHPLRNWNATMHHMVHAGNTSEAEALQSMLSNVLENVRRYSEEHEKVGNQSSRLEGMVYDLTKNQFSLQKDLNELRQTLLDLKLTLLSNRTNDSNTVGNDEIRRMIETANNLTLDKQELSAKTLDFKLYEQSFKVDKALELAKEYHDRLTILGKQVDQYNVWQSSPVRQQGQLVQQSPGLGGEVRGHSDGLIVAVLVLVCLLMGVMIFAIFRSYRRPFTGDHKRYHQRDSSLTTIVDNVI